MKKLLIFSILAIFLSGCTSSQEKVERHYLSDVKAGGTLRINKPLKISAGQVRSTLQDGYLYPAPAAVNKYDPYCQMIVRTLDEHNKEIPAIDFHIKRVVRDQEPYTRKNKSRKMMVASASDDLTFMSGGVVTDWLIKTYFYIESEQYPDIFRFVCAQAWDGYLSRRMYMSEFENAVGKYITLLPPGPNQDRPQ